MEVKIGSSAEGSLEVEIEGEDYSIAEIVHHELLKEKSVVFSGVTAPHPLIKKLVVKLQVEKAEPLDLFIACVKTAQKKTDEIFKELSKILKDKGGK